MNLSNGRQAEVLVLGYVFWQQSRLWQIEWNTCPESVESSRSSMGQHLLKWLNCEEGERHRKQRVQDLAPEDILLEMPKRCDLSLL